jgi:hypothetical protein
MKQTLGLLLASCLLAADLPVREVILYKHGIGYFSRSGDLGAGESARLDFNARDMNDVLKSLTVVEKGGGKITGLRYDASIPLSQKLADLPFQIEKNRPLAEILDQLRGARITLSLGTGTISGAIVSGRVVPGTNERPQSERLVVMLDSGELRTADLGEVTGIQFADPRLQQQFRDYLIAVDGSRSREQRSVYIDSSDKAARSINVSYVIPVPVWKSSYRLIFQPNSQPTLEGWAIVDNTTGQDWTGVRLSLVSGRPISFVSRLYEPRYAERPVAELAEEQAKAPIVHQGAIGGAVPGSADLMAKGRRSALADQAVIMAAPPPPPAPMKEAAIVAPSVVESAAGRELGDLFEYSLPTPVTVKRNESAMLPFLQDKLAARKLLIYTGDGLHPTNAAEISNTSGKTLDGGPITVFDGGAYGGEALMETTKAGDKRLISYAVDLGTRITTAFDSSSEQVREIHVRRGILTFKNAVSEVRTYTIRNVDARPKTLILEHAVRPEYKLVGPKASETTADAYRFEVALAASAEQKFAVTEERVIENSISLINLTPDILITYVQNQALSASARKQLEKVADLKRQVAAAEQDMGQADADADRMAKDAQRVRQNLESLNRVAGQQAQVQTYAKQLADLEAAIAGARDKRAAAENRRQQLMTELNTTIEALQF